MDWVGWPEESDSLLIWPDPAPTRQTSTQRPEPQVLTFKAPHKLNSSSWFEGWSGWYWQLKTNSEMFVILHSMLQTQRRWTPSSTSRSREVALLSVMWWWVNKTCHRFFKHFSKTTACPFYLLHCHPLPGIRDPAIRDERGEQQEEEDAPPHRVCRLRGSPKHF